MHSKLTKIITVVAVSAAFTGCVAGNDKDGSAWQCEAKKMVSSNYDGSNYAYVHLQGYPQGARYKVELNDAMTEATGKTGDGTPFTCTKQM